MQIGKMFDASFELLNVLLGGPTYTCEEDGCNDNGCSFKGGSNQIEMKFKGGDVDVDCW